MPLHLNHRGAGRSTQHLRAYAMPLVFLVLALIALGIGSAFYTLQGSLVEMRRVVGTRRAAIACDAASRMATDAVTQGLLQARVLTDAGLASAASTAVYLATGTALTAALPLGLMPQATLTSFGVTATLALATGTALTTGPFAGLQAKAMKADIDIGGYDPSSGKACAVTDTFSLWSVSPFQFHAFSNGDVSWDVPSTETSRSVFANGKLCVDARAGATLNGKHLIASGSIGIGPFVTASSGCSGSSAGTIKLQTGVPQVTWTGTTPTSEVFPTSRQATLPVTPAPPMQGDNYTPPYSQVSARWLVDVPTPQDSAGVQGYRFAQLSTVRIIDGVWYVKDTSSTPLAWPGRAIWSDHRGTVALQEAQDIQFPDPMAAPVPRAVGRDDLSASGFRYSYYETDSSTGFLDLSHIADASVVSYGALLNTAANTWVPGPRSNPNVCAAGTDFVPFNDGSCVSQAAALLDATRTGFRDLNIAAGNFATDGAKPNILPINIDVAALLGALGETSGGELGDRLNDSDTAPFNGIVYITNTWQGALTGLSVATAGNAYNTAPYQGERSVLVPPFAVTGTTNAIAASAITPLPTGTVGPLAITHIVRAPPLTDLDTIDLGATVQSALFVPRPLCVSDAIANPRLDAAAGVIAAVNCDPIDPIEAGEISNLATVAYGADGAAGIRPNAVRLYNGANLLGFRRYGESATSANDGGLTIVTNLPLYVMGDWNSTDPPAGEKTPRSLLGGDRITYLSRFWSDSDSPWNPAAAPTKPSQAANPSQVVRSAVLTGRTDPPPALAVPWPSLQKQFFTIENQRLQFHGSLFAGYRTVFGDEDKSVSSSTTLEWLDDPQLENINMQPLGTPTYVVDVSDKWHQIR